MAVPKGTRVGGRKKGTPNKSTADIKALAQVHVEVALTTLAKIAKSGESETAQVAACNAILDRAYGKPKQSMDIDANVKATVQKIERRIVKADH